MEHCSYRYSDFYQLVPLLMSCMESQLSNKPKQCILKNQIVEIQLCHYILVVIIVKMFYFKFERLLCHQIVIIVIVNGKHCRLTFLFLLPLSNLLHCLCLRISFYSKNTPNKSFFLTHINIFGHLLPHFYCLFSQSTFFR